MRCRIGATAFPAGPLETGQPQKISPKDLEVIRHQEDNQGWVTTVTLPPTCELGSNTPGTPMRLPRLMLAFSLAAAITAAYPQTTAKTAGSGKAQKFPVTTSSAAAARYFETGMV